MTFMMHTGRQQRSFAGKAPIPSNDSYEPSEDVKTIFRHSQPVKWKPDAYSRQLFNHMFKKWKE